MPSLPIFRLMLLALFAAPMLAQADVRYQISVVGGANSRAYDVNNSGQMVGYNGAGHAFLYDGASFSDLGTLGGANSAAFRINDNGQIVGTSDTADLSRGFIWSGGVMTPIPTTNFSSAIGINNSGAVVGMQLVETSDGESYRHGYLYQGGTFTDLGTLSYGDGSQGNAINDAGHIVGSAANYIQGAPNYPTTSFYYRDGVMTDIGNFGGVWSGATDINSMDQVVGYSGLGDPIEGELYPERAFLWSGGELHNLGSLFGNLSTRAFGINNLSQIVGSGDVEFGAHGFLYENGAMIDLNSLIDPASGWMVREAFGINDMQQIAATACKDDVCYAVRLDLVSAIPEPHGYASLLAGLAMLGMVRRRRQSRPFTR